MNDIEAHIGYLFNAELQLRLASAVGLTTTLKKQPLDRPLKCTHGKHDAYYSRWRSIRIKRISRRESAPTIHFPHGRTHSAEHLLRFAKGDCEPVACQGREIVTEGKAGSRLKPLEGKTIEQDAQ
jgi:hypothetical protein